MSLRKLGFMKGAIRQKEAGTGSQVPQYPSCMKTSREGVGIKVCTTALQKVNFCIRILENLHHPSCVRVQASSCPMTLRLSMCICWGPACARGHATFCLTPGERFQVCTCTKDVCKSRPCTSMPRPAERRQTRAAAATDNGWRHVQLLN